MILANLVLLLAPAPAVAAEVSWAAPSYFIAGAPFVVEVSIDVPASGGSIPVWAFSPAAFSIDGRELGSRETPQVDYAGATHVSLRFDLGEHLSADKQTLELSCDLEGAGPARSVNRVEAADQGLDFMGMPEAELGSYWVLIQTNRGDMLAEFWPDKAPMHVRNFLDLAYTGFYDGVTFHRVIPGFMIQGGDPVGNGTGNGPRQLDAEFNPDIKHVPGVLSMARSDDPNSASCQFFVMHGPAPFLDGQYSAFGKLKGGLEVVDAIVNSPRDARDRPEEPQLIEKMLVLRAPAAH